MTKRKRTRVVGPNSPYAKLNAEEMREIYLHEEGLINATTDWFFVGHAILAEAFMAAHEQGRFIVAPILTIGIYSSAMWILIGRRQYRQQKQLRRLLRKISPTFDVIESGRDRLNKSFIHFPSRSSRIFLVYLPLLWLFCWTALAGHRVIAKRWMKAHPDEQTEVDDPCKSERPDSKD